MSSIDPAWAALIGSASTLLITQVSDYFKLTKSNKFTLKKELYLKKLTVFEKATAYLNASHTNLTSIAYKFKAMLTPDTVYTETDTSEIAKQMQQALADGYVPYNSLTLYLPIADNDEERELEMEAQVLLGEMMHIVKSDGDFQHLSQKVNRFEEISNRAREIQLEKIDMLKEDLLKYQTW